MFFLNRGRGFLCFRLLFLILLLAGAQDRASGAEQRGPSLTRCLIYQIGATEAVLELAGQDLPAPEVALEGTRARVTLRGVRSDRAEIPRDLEAVPLILDITAGQEAGDTVIRLTAAKPLRLHSRYGGARSRTHTLRLSAEKAETAWGKSPSPAASGPALHDPLPLPDRNEKITLDTRDIELRDVFRMLAGSLKKNVIIDPSVPSVHISLTMKDVPVSSALGYLMRAYDVSYCSLGADTLVIGTKEGLSRLSGDEEVRVFPVAYGDPAALIAPLARLTNLPDGKFAADARLRVLYVSATPWKLAEVAGILKEMDRPGPQVMIQAKIFEFAEGSSKELETALNAVYDHWWFSYSGQGGGRGGYIDDNRQGRSFTGPPSGYPLPGMTGLETPMTGIWREFDAAFRALETKGKGRTLANPSIIAIDGQKAQIRMTEDYPYISSRDDAGNPTWSTETVGPQLTLTPRVGRGGVIDLELTVATGDVIEMITGSTGEKMPRTSNRSITDRIYIHDGEPFVVGGLFRENQTRQRGRIPIVGQIPLLGELFTYRYDERSRTQVVILVIPYILKTPDGE